MPRTARSSIKGRQAGGRDDTAETGSPTGGLSAAAHWPQKSNPSPDSARGKDSDI
jgi:hypothetical protein